MIPDKFFLTPQERDSALWKRLKEEVERDLKVMRVQNDGDKGIKETAKLRGKIAQAKKFLGYESGPNMIPSD